VHEHRLRTDGSYRRKHVFKRDGGICAECGRDCAMLERDLLRMLYADPSKLDAALAKIGMRRRTPEEVEHRRSRPSHDLVLSLRGDVADPELPAWEPGVSLWQADHVIPVHKGGGSVGPEGLVTLCIWCHKKKTRGEAKRRAQARKEQPPEDLIPDDPKAPPDWLFDG
jgi:hypothetical protein